MDEAQESSLRWQDAHVNAVLTEGRVLDLARLGLERDAVLSDDAEALRATATKLLQAMLDDMQSVAARARLWQLLATAGISVATLMAGGNSHAVRGRGPTSAARGDQPHA